MPLEPIHLKVVDRCAVLTIEAIAAALPSARFRGAVGHHLQQALGDENVGAIAIIGHAGALDFGLDPERDIAATANPGWLPALLLGPKLVVTAAAGAIGGRGLSILCLGDLILTTSDATFQCGPPALASAAGYAVGWTLAARIGMSRAWELTLTSRRIGAAQALEIRLASRLVPLCDLETATLQAAAELAHQQPGAGRTKELLRAATPPSALNGYIQAESRGLMELWNAGSSGDIANDT